MSTQSAKEKAIQFTRRLVHASTDIPLDHILVDYDDTHSTQLNGEYCLVRLNSSEPVGASTSTEDQQGLALVSEDGVQLISEFGYPLVTEGHETRVRTVQQLSSVLGVSFVNTKDFKDLRFAASARMDNTAQLVYDYGVGIRAIINTSDNTQVINGSYKMKGSYVMYVWHEEVTTELTGLIGSVGLQVDVVRQSGEHDTIINI